MVCRRDTPCIGHVYTVQLYSGMHLVYLVCRTDTPCIGHVYTVQLSAWYALGILGLSERHAIGHVYSFYSMVALGLLVYLIYIHNMYIIYMMPLFDKPSTLHGIYCMSV